MTARSVVRVVAAVAMMAIGVAHFAAPDGFVAIVPAWLPAPRALVLVSGFFEVLGGAGLLVPRVRRAASWGLVALYVCVFPANVNMALHDVQPAGLHIPEALLWARLPFQIVFIAVALWVGKPDRTPANDGPGSAGARAA
ncbi:MAG TPA: hypothetical protein VGG39_02750 [Polyangiaceae bacterium]